MNESAQFKLAGCENFEVVKLEIDNKHEIDQKESLDSAPPPCSSALKCEYDPDCGCPQCRFNAITNVKTVERQIKQEIKLEDNDNKVKIETELACKCVKDEFEEGECGCNECIGVLESTQSNQVQQEQPQVNSPVQEQPISTEPIEYQDSSDDTIIDCPTPDYVPSFFSEDEDDDEDEDSDENTELESDIEETNIQKSNESNSDEEEDGTGIILKQERPFKCDHCVCSFVSKQYLKYHQATVHQIGKCYQYKCKWHKCKYFSNDRRHAVQHIVRLHFKKGDDHLDTVDFIRKIAITKKSMIKPDGRKLIIILRLNCPKCPDHFPNKRQLNNHLSRCHKIEQYRCVVKGCSAFFNIRFCAHKKEAHRNVKVWQCDHCVYTTKTYRKLSIHTMNAHEKGHFRCAITGCGFFSLTNRYEIRKHYEAKHRKARKRKSRNRNGLQMPSANMCSGETQTDCPTVENEQKDKNNHPNTRSSRTVNKSKRKYQEEFSENDNDSDFEPSDDDEEDAKEITESNSENDESSLRHANESNSDDDETVKVSRKKNNQELKIITVHLNCWECDETFVDIAALNKHLRKCHQILSQRCLVRDCLSSFNSPAKLRRHYLAKHGDCGDGLPCWKCDSKTYTNHGQLLSHTWKMHQQGHFKCSHEGCQFETHTNRKCVYNHYMIKHSDKSTFACPFKGCGMTFPFQAKLKLHERIHKKEKSFKCEHCGSKYATNVSLKTHLTRDHRIGKMIHCKCEWTKCGSVFNCMYNAYKHIRKMHFKDGERRHPKEFLSMIPSTGKPVIKITKSNNRVVILRLNCLVDRCSKHFTNKDQLNIHLSECHQIEKFRCVAPRCSASFQNCLHFTAHKNEVHGKIKIWHCDQCDYKGNRYQLLVQHKRLYHEEGHFACGHRGCKFVSRTYRNEVFKHGYKHKKK